MADYTAEIARLEALLNLGATEIDVDGVTTRYDLAAIRIAKFTQQRRHQDPHFAALVLCQVSQDIHGTRGGLQLTLDVGNGCGWIETVKVKALVRNLESAVSGRRCYLLPM